MCRVVWTFFESGRNRINYYKEETHNYKRNNTRGNTSLGCMCLFSNSIVLGYSGKFIVNFIVKELESPYHEYHWIFSKCHKSQYSYSFSRMSSCFTLFQYFTLCSNYSLSKFKLVTAIFSLHPSVYKRNKSCISGWGCRWRPSIVECCQGILKFSSGPICVIISWTLP